jgi:ubiquitin-conjugating enzyme E2 variant
VTRPVRPLFLDCDRSQGVVAWIGIMAHALLIAWYGAWLVIHGPDAGPLAYRLPVVILGALFVADLVSGVVHWATDTWFDEVVYTRVISIAREHHIHPHHIVGYGFRDYVAYSSWPILISLAPVGLLLTLLPHPGAFVFDCIVVCLVVSICMFFGTHAHRLGHRRSRWRVVRLLQRCRFLITTRHHGVHHRDNHDVRYCVINGWANHVCDAIGVWRGLEWLVHRLTGAVPRRSDHEWFARYAPYSPRRGRFVIGPPSTNPARSIP